MSAESWVGFVAEGRIDALSEAPGSAVTALDTRSVAVHSLEERNRALEAIATDAGPATEAIALKVNSSFEPIRAQLNEVAGGQASPRVMMLAHHAQRVETALELQTAISMTSVGRYIREGGESPKKAGKTEIGLRNLAGIGAFASDLLNKAYAAAEAEGKAKAAKLEPVDALMATLGVPGPDGEGSTQVPDLTGGVGSIGAPLPQNPSSSPPLSVGPLSQPKPTPAAPRLNLDPESPSVFAAPLPKKPPRRKQET